MRRDTAPSAANVTAVLLVAVYEGPFEEWREIAYEFAGKGPVNADALRPWTHALSVLLLLLFRQRSKINHECAPAQSEYRGALRPSLPPPPFVWDWWHPALEWGLQGY